MRRILSYLLPVLLSSCVWFEGDSRVFVSSDPQGAQIWIDGQLTEHTTPAQLDLGGIFGDTHKIQVGKKGYEDEVRIVTHYTQFDTTKINEWVGDANTIPFPTWATFDDLLFPWKVQWVYVPHNLHVKLFPEGTFRPLPGEDQATNLRNPSSPSKVAHVASGKVGSSNGDRRPENSGLGDGKTTEADGAPE